jgi:hypothetical protein
VKVNAVNLFYFLEKEIKILLYNTYLNKSEQMPLILRNQPSIISLHLLTSFDISIYFLNGRTLPCQLAMKVFQLKKGVTFQSLCI